MSDNKIGFFGRIYARALAFYNYCSEGVWDDPRDNLKTRIIKTLNLSVSSFFNANLQNKSMALTYTTVLSIVPAFALLVAIGRGFGLQDTLQNQLYILLPSQAKVISTALSFVDSYLKSSTQGVFVGVGIVVLLWTMISLLSSIEDSFNIIWDVKHSRTLYQKITDYIAICLMIPVLMICSSGVAFFMSDIIQSNIHLPFLTPVLNIILSFAPLFLCWLAFTLSYYLIPNTKVQFKYAAIAGAMGAVAFEILQLLFLNGQIYVSKYNAIYGSFAFLPLMLVWLQFSWLVLLTCCMIAYSMQNVFTFNLMGDVSKISDRGWHQVSLIVMTVCAKRFAEKKVPLTEADIATEYFLPIRMVSNITAKLKEAKLLYEVNIRQDVVGFTPAMETDTFTVEDFYKAYDTAGESDFIPKFDSIYKDLLTALSETRESAYAQFGKLIVRDLPLPTPTQIKEILTNN